MTLDQIYLCRPLTPPYVLTCTAVSIGIEFHGVVLVNIIQPYLFEPCVIHADVTSWGV